MAVKIELDTLKYERSHGCKPRGFGSWIFECDQIPGQPNWLTVRGTLTEASREAKKRVKAMMPPDASGLVVLSILP